MLTTNELPTEIVRSVSLKDAGSESSSFELQKKQKKKKCGVFGNDLKFAYQWNENDGNLIGYDSVSGVNFGEYTFGDDSKDLACIETVVEFENESTLACCAVAYRDRCLLCCVDLGLSKVVHSIKIKKHPLTTLTVITHGSSSFDDLTPKLHPILRGSSGLIAAGQIGGRVLLIDMQAKHSNWWKHEEFNPTSLNMVNGQNCDDPATQQKAKSCSQKGQHLAVVLDGELDYSEEVTCMQFCKEPNILIVGHSTGHFDIWSLTTLTKLFSGEPTGGRISHIMSMLPEDDPRKSVYVWVVENGRPDDSIVEDSNICASANLHVLVYKSGDSSLCEYEEFESVNCMFRLLLDKVGDYNEVAKYTTQCVSVSPISIDINNQYLSTLNCTGLCSFVWVEKDLNPKSPPKYYSATFDLGRWYAEEMPKHALISDLETSSFSYLAYSQLDTGRSDLLEAKVSSSGTKKNIWELNEVVTSYVAATSFSMLLLTNDHIIEVTFPGIQSYLFDKIDELKPWELIEPHNLFTKCMVAGLMPEGLYDAKSIYPKLLCKVKMVEAIYEVAINHNLLAFMRRCATEFFDGKYESASLSTQHLLEWAWNKAVDVKGKIDDLLNLLFSGQDLTQSDKNSHNQYVNDLKCIAKLFSHVEREHLVHSDESMKGLQQRIRGLNLVNDYLSCVQYFCTCRLLPDAADNGLWRLDAIKNEYSLRRQKEGSLLVDLIMERFGNELKELWSSLGGDGKYPPPSMHSILAIFLLDAAHVKDKHCLMLYFLFDITKASRMNESLAMGYKEMISSSECAEQVLTSHFLWSVDHGYLHDALKFLGNEKLDPTWIETIFAHLNTRSSSKDLYEVYRSIGFETDTVDRKKFVISLFLNNGLVVPAFKWIRSTNAGVFDNVCYAFFLKRTHEVGGLDKLVAKELSLNPQELAMLFNYLKLHSLGNLITKLEEKIGTSNFVPCLVADNNIYNDILDFKLPEAFRRTGGRPIESEEVRKFLKGSFSSMKYTDFTPLHRRILPEVSKPSILKTTDSPAASPLHLSVGVTPSPKRLRFQLPKPAEVSTSSNESSPVSEGIIPFIFQSPQASTPKTALSSTPETDKEDVFEFSLPSPVSHPKLEGVKHDESDVYNSPLLKTSFATSTGEILEPDRNFAAHLDVHNTSTPIDTEDTTESPAQPFHILEESEDSLYMETEDQKEEETKNQEVSIEEDSFDFETCTPVIQRVAPYANTEQRRRNITELAANVLPVFAMEVSEDEDEGSSQPSEEEDKKLSSDAHTSPSSISNESFYSICASAVSPNSSVTSFTSALEDTIIVEDADDGDICPITKKRRSQVFEEAILTPVKSVEVENLDEEDFSPSKFWQPPALAHLAPGPSTSTSSVDLSLLPKPPPRPSPRRPIRRHLEVGDDAVDLEISNETDQRTPEKPASIESKEESPKTPTVGVGFVPHPSESTDVIDSSSSSEEVEIKSSTSPEQKTPEKSFSPEQKTPEKSFSPEQKTPDKSFSPGATNKISFVSQDESGKLESGEMPQDAKGSLAAGDKRYDSVFCRSINSTLDRDLLDLEAEQNAKKAAERLALELEEDSEADVTLDKTVILVSSGSSMDSPLKMTRRSMSPRKAIKVEQKSPESDDQVESVIASACTLQSSDKMETESKIEPHHTEPEEVGGLEAESAEMETEEAAPLEQIEISTSLEEETLAVQQQAVEPEPEVSNAEPPVPVGEEQKEELSEASEEASCIQVPEDKLEVQPPALLEPVPEEEEETAASVEEKAPSPAVEEKESPKMELRHREQTPSLLEVPKKKGRTPSPRTSPRVAAKQLVVHEEPEPAKEKRKPAPTPRSKALGEKIEEQLDQFSSSTVGKEDAKPQKKSKKVEAAKEKLKKPKKPTAETKETEPKPDTKTKTVLKNEEKPAKAAKSSKPAPKSVKKKREEEAKATTAEEKKSKKVVKKAETAPSKQAATKTAKKGEEEAKVELPTTGATKKKTVAKSKGAETKPAEAPAPKKRNLRSASQDSRSSQEVPAQESQDIPVSPRKRGRPRKNPHSSPEPSSQESAVGPTRRGRSRPPAAVSPGPNAQEEQKPAPRVARRRSRSAVSDKAPSTSGLRTRSMSVASDVSTASQASNRSRKRKATGDTDSDDESTTSEASLRRSTRKRKVVETKRGPKVSIIPEENA